MEANIEKTHFQFLNNIKNKMHNNTAVTRVILLLLILVSYALLIHGQEEVLQFEHHGPIDYEDWEYAIVNVYANKTISSTIDIGGDFFISDSIVIFHDDVNVLAKLEVTNSTLKFAGQLNMKAEGIFTQKTVLTALGESWKGIRIFGNSGLASCNADGSYISGTKFEDVTVEKAEGVSVKVEPDSSVSGCLHFERSTIDAVDNAVDVTGTRSTVSLMSSELLAGQKAVIASTANIIANKCNFIARDVAIEGGVEVGVSMSNFEGSAVAIQSTSDTSSISVLRSNFKQCSTSVNFVEQKAGSSFNFRRNNVNGGNSSLVIDSMPAVIAYNDFYSCSQPILVNHTASCLAEAYKTKIFTNTFSAFTGEAVIKLKSVDGGDKGECSLDIYENNFRDNSVYGEVLIGNISGSSVTVTRNNFFNISSQYHIVSKGVTLYASSDNYFADYQKFSNVAYMGTSFEAIPMPVCNGLYYNEDGVCSYRGKCVADNICDCWPGFNGTYCEILPDDSDFTMEIVGSPTSGPCQDIMLDAQFSRAVPDARFHWSIVDIDTQAKTVDLIHYVEAVSQIDGSLRVIDQLIPKKSIIVFNLTVVTDYLTVSDTFQVTKEEYQGLYIAPSNSIPAVLNTRQTYSIAFRVQSKTHPCVRYDTFHSYTIRQGDQVLLEDTGMVQHLYVFPWQLSVGGTYYFSVDVQGTSYPYTLTYDFNVTVTDPKAAIDVVNDADPAKLYQKTKFTAVNSSDPDAVAEDPEYEWSCTGCILQNTTGVETTIMFIEPGLQTVTLLFIPNSLYPQRNNSITVQYDVKYNPLVLSVDHLPNYRGVCDGDYYLSVETNREAYNPKYTWEVYATEQNADALSSYINSVSGANLESLLMVRETIPVGSTSIRVNITEQYHGTRSIIYTFTRGDYKNVQMDFTGNVAGVTTPGRIHYISTKQRLNIAASLSSTETPCVWKQGARWTVLNSQKDVRVNNFVIDGSLYRAGGPFDFPVVADIDSSYVVVQNNVTVVVSKPIVTIKGGDQVVKVGDTLTVEVGTATDPDLAQVTTTECFKWTCVGCTLGTPNARRTTANFSQLGFYSISVQYTPDCNEVIRTNSVTAQVRVVSTPIPMLNITTTLPAVISAQQRIKVEATVDRIDRMFRNEITFTWLIKSGSTVLKSYPATSRLQALMLAENELTDNRDYEFVLRARFLDAADIELNNAQVSVRTRTAATPVISSFTVTPLNGTALKTNFLMECSGSQSDGGALSFRTEILDTTTNTFSVLRRFTTANQLSSILPEGKGLSKTVTVRCVLQNKYGNRATRELAVQVEQETTIDETVSTLKDIIDSDDATSQLSVVVNTVETVTQELASTGQTEKIEQVQQVVDALLNALYVSTKNTTSSVESTETTANALEVLSRSSAISTQATAVAFNILSSSLSQRGAVSTKTVSSAARFASNMLISKPKDEVVKASAPNVIAAVREALTADLAVSQEPVLLSTDAFDISVKLDYGLNLQNTQVSSEDSNTVEIPTLDILDQEKTYSYEFVVYKNGVNPYDFGNDTSSSVLSFKILDGEEKVRLVDLQEPLVIVLNLEKDIAENETSIYSHVCSYWDGGDEWGTDGCMLHSKNTTHITCHCTHTTSFASFIIYDPKNPNKSPTGLYVASIILNSFFALTSLSLLILSIVFRNEQPMRSRFLVPFIGLSAILIESVVQGIIRNSLLIAADGVSDYKAINILSYLIMIIVNPIVLVSLFVFLYQQIRYFFMNNLYTIMNNEGKNAAIIKFYRVLTSKVLFVVCMVVIWAATLIYYVVFMATYASDTINELASTSINAISFAAMAFVLAVLIVAAFLWDSIVVLVHKARKALARMSQEDDDKEIAVEKRIVHKIFNTFRAHFTSDDPFLFRTETIFMTIAMLMLIVAIALGLSDRYAGAANSSKDYTALKVIQAIFDWIYISFRIASFGGFALFSFALMKIKQRNLPYKQMSDVDSDKQTSDILEQVLNDQNGYALMKEYCRREFSVENCLLYEEITKLRSDNLILSPEERLLSLQRLDLYYVKKGAEFEVNISNKVKVAFEELTSGNTAIGADNLENVLMMLHGEMLKNLSDTFVRFVSTTEYETYQEFRKMHLELASSSSFAVKE